MTGLPIWQPFALAALRGRFESRRRDSIKNSIDLSFALGRQLPTQRLMRWAERDIFVTKLFLESRLSIRIVFERTRPVTIWAVTLEREPLTE